MRNFVRFQIATDVHLESVLDEQGDICGWMIIDDCIVRAKLSDFEMKNLVRKMMNRILDEME